MEVGGKEEEGCWLTLSHGEAEWKEEGRRQTDIVPLSTSASLLPSLRPTTELPNMQLRRRRGDIRGEDGGEGLKRGRGGGATTIPTSRSVAPSPHPSLPRERRRKGPSTPREDGGRGGVLLTPFRQEDFLLLFVRIREVVRKKGVGGRKRGTSKCLRRRRLLPNGLCQYGRRPCRRVASSSFSRLGDPPPLFCSLLPGQ